MFNIDSTLKFQLFLMGVKKTLKKKLRNWYQNFHVDSTLNRWSMLKNWLCPLVTVQFLHQSWWFQLTFLYPGESLSSPLGTHPSPEKAYKRVPFPTNVHSSVQHWRRLEKGVLFHHQLSLRDPNCWGFNSTQRFSNYYQVCLKYWMQEMNIFVKMFRTFLLFSLFALIWTSPDYAVQ